MVEGTCFFNTSMEKIIGLLRIAHRLVLYDEEEGVVGATVSTSSSDSDDDTLSSRSLTCPD